MEFAFEEAVLIAQAGYEKIRIEAWGRDALRVRATLNANFSGAEKGLGEPPAQQAECGLFECGAYIRNGKLRCEVHHNGYLTFFEGERVLLKEYYRDFSWANEHSPSMKLRAREYRSHGTDYEITLRFEAQEEKLFGMGQYQQPIFDLKGCVLELAQRNSQISIPFVLSSCGYGFLLNHPGVGEAMFGSNFTQWREVCSDEIDYWVVAGSPKEVLERYTEVTGRAPAFPENALGLWQSKLRYRTQEEVLSVAREYKKRGIPLDVIVIDFFHWIRQGDWAFDEDYWPDVRAMTEELHEMGVRCMVSVWPTVDRKSVNYQPMRERGLLVRTERGAPQCFDFQGDTVIYDATNPAARDYLWACVKRNYYDKGVDCFWLDEAEPEYAAYDFDHFRYSVGPVVKTGNLYPREHVKGFYEGLKRAGREDIVNLTRSAWVGSQKYAALVWSGDICSNFQTLRDQLTAGLHIGIAGIPWWTTDTGGFFGDVTAEGFSELLIRWFEFSAFSPVLRLHGDRGPHDIPPLSDLDHGGGFSPTGRPNEVWSYGEEVETVLRQYVRIRTELKSYLRGAFHEASEKGYPVMRTLFFEFPEDAEAWEIGDEYMLGSTLLVAPVLYEGMRSRKVYLPRGEWEDFFTGEVFQGGTYEVAVPLDKIPVFIRRR